MYALFVCSFTLLWLARPPGPEAEAHNAGTKKLTIGRGALSISIFGFQLGAHSSAEQSAERSPTGAAGRSGRMGAAFGVPHLDWWQLASLYEACSVEFAEGHGFRVMAGFKSKFAELHIEFAVLGAGDRGV